MKKYLQYILILVTLIGVLSPALNVATATTCINTKDTTDKNACGICTVTNGRSQSKPVLTQAECYANVPAGSPWVQIIPAAPPATKICTYVKGETDKTPAKATNQPCINGIATDSSSTPGVYNFLAPLPCTEGTTGCVKDANGNFVLQSFNPSATDGQGNNASLGIYLNIMIKIFIGIAAVLAMVMIVMGGIQYMTSELISSKEEGKHRITNAILGLLIALGSWLVLYTINPNLLNTNVGIPITEIDYIQNFEVSGPQLRSLGGSSIKINFNSEALPAARNAAGKTGVDEALILAIFSQESGGGRNTGGCLTGDPRAKMKDEDKAALKTIVGGNIDNINVSCAGSVGYGGAIGLTQFLPTTWIRFKDTAAGYLGHQPDPWNVNDALMVTAIYLKTLGGVASPYNAACGYFGKCSSGGIDYAAQVVSKMAKIKQQIAEGSGFSGASKGGRSIQ